MRSFAVDQVVLGTVFEEDDTSILFKDVVIARELVQTYNIDGEEKRAYKSADSIKIATDTLTRLLSRPVGTEVHPDSGFLMTHEETKGRLEDIRFVKNLPDEKTDRPNGRGTMADVRLFKDAVPKRLLDAMKKGKDKQDVSVGFAFDWVDEPDSWNGDEYDFRQDKIFYDHVIVGIDHGRCPSPLCGLSQDQRKIGYDVGLTLLSQVKEGKDVLIHTDGLSLEQINTKLDEIRAEIKGLRDQLHVIYEKHKLPDEVDEIWEKINVLDVEYRAYTQAKINLISSNDSADPCPVCDLIHEMGPKAFSKFLFNKVGDNLLTILELDEEEKPKDPPEKPTEEKIDEEMSPEVTAALEKSKTLLEES